MNSIEEWEMRIRRRVAARSRPFSNASDLALVEQAMRAHPASAALWVLRGDMILLTDEEVAGYPDDEALRSYLRAADLDPQSPRPPLEIGHFFDAHKDDPAGALPYFRKAIDLGGGEPAARALEEALRQIEDDSGE